MSLINLRDRTINAKVVYYGTALSGKTTSLKRVHQVMDPHGRTELVSLNTKGDRTLFFDFLPIPLGSVGGFDVKLQAFTVPGQVKYNLTRRYVLRGADAVIFVVDSRREAFADNVASLASLHENLVANGVDPTQVPLLIQYNKRDVDDPVPVEELRAALNHEGHPDFETVATTGEGVFEAFSELCCELLAQFAGIHNFADPAEIRSRLGETLSLVQESWEIAGRPVDDQPPPSVASSPSLADAVSRAAEIGGPHSVIRVETDAECEDMPELSELLERAVETNIETAKIMAELHETRRRLGDHVTELAALHATGVMIASELDSQRLISRILERALGTVGTSHGSVLFWDAERDCLTEGLVQGFARDPLCVGDHIDPAVSTRIRAGETFSLQPNDCPSLLRPPGPDEPGPTTALIAPLVHQREVRGALAVYVFDHRSEKDKQRKLRFLEAVAAQAVVALENARLYGRVEELNRDLERRVAERTQELEHAYRELKQLDLLKDDFLASMSHELFTPLTSIRGFAEILLATASDDGEDAVSDRTEFATIVKTESQRLARLLQAVMDLNMLESEGTTLSPAPTNLREVLLAIYRDLRPELRARDVKVRVREEQNMPPARADALWIARVFRELLTNACKFGPDGETIDVTIRRDGRLAIVEVEDRGPGVREELRATIFQKFKQLGDVLTDKPQGLGLGLPTARVVMERLSGQIWHAPRDGGGSVFGFALPIAEAAVVANTPAPPA